MQRTGGMKTLCMAAAAAALVVVVLVAVATIEAAPAKPDCGKGSEYFDAGPDSSKYVHCRKGEVLFKECPKGQAFNKAKSGCEARTQADTEQADAAELTIVPGDWRSVHGWCWGWPIYTTTVVYRYQWVTGWHSGWYGRYYGAVALSEGGGKGRGTQNESGEGEHSSGEHSSGDSGEHSGEADGAGQGDEHSGEHAGEHSGGDQQHKDENHKEEQHDLVQGEEHHE